MAELDRHIADRQQFADKVESRRFESGNSVLTEAEFLADFAKVAKQPKQGKVFSEAMVFFPDVKGRAVADALKGASPDLERVLVIDAYSELAMSNKVVALARLTGTAGAVETQLQEYHSMLADLRESGVTVDVLNKSEGGLLKKAVKHGFPFIGTNHTKGTYVFDQEMHKQCLRDGVADTSTTFYLHTSNFEDTANINMVLKIVGPLAYELKKEYDEMHANPPEADYAKPLDEHSSIYVDSGKPGESIIMDKAVDLIKNAQQSVRVATLMTPDGAFAEALNDKYREWEGAEGKAFDVITTEFYPDKTAFPQMPFLTVDGTFWAVDQLNQFKLAAHGIEFPILRDNNRWVHPKCLIIDDTWLFIGSMNFAQSGVKAGTREWQFLTDDPNFVQGALRMFRDYKTIIKATESEDSFESQVLYAPEKENKEEN